MHPEFSFKYFYWSQKLTLKNVRLQIRVLQYDDIIDHMQYYGKIEKHSLILSLTKKNRPEDPRTNYQTNQIVDTNTGEKRQTEGKR